MSHDAKKDTLRHRKAPIEMSPDEFRTAGHRLVDDIARLLGSIRERPVNVDESPGELCALLPQGSLPDEGSEPSKLLEEVTSLLFQHSLFNGHPRFYGYITSAAAPIGALADLLAASVNPNVGGWQLSPLASEIEKQSIRWIADMIGFPTGGGGLFVSGGNMANFVCFLAARRAKAPWDICREGMTKADGRMLVYATNETHTWIQKAMSLFGHGHEAIRTIPIDKNLSADIESLHKEIEDDRRRGDHPFLIIGSAGTVSTGAVDPLADMAAVAREYDLWLHVDGAYGALAACLPDASADLTGLSEADSVAVDPHKWLYTPLEAGCVLVRDPAALQNAFSYKPPYYHFATEDESRTNFYEYGLQNSRGFRALKVWLGLRQVGRQGYVKMIGDDIRLAKEMYRLVDADADFEAFTQSLSITTFRYVPQDLTPGTERVERYLSELNNAVLTRLKASGESFLSNAIVDGKFLLRGCIVNFRTSLEDIEALPDIIRRHAQALDAEMRPKDL
ncbi:MAG: aminotransferase class V-fold PLP-dependent enzyme [Candidatus Krumholzibacteria bacterium]|nr:aminotransferase class V-fold PLP-dependent enzyme [Candidatus Krumholzibacteria bacterium]